MLRAGLKKLKAYQQKYGVLGLFKKSVLWVCSFVFFYRPLHIYKIEGVPKTKVKALCLLEIRRGKREDIDLIVGLGDYLNKSDIRRYVQYHFDSGGKLFLALNEGKLAHVCWLFYSPGFEGQWAHIHLKKDEAHIASAHTESEFRGQNIYPAVLQHILKYVAEKNIRRVYITSSPKNIASVRGIEKAGFSKIGEIHGLKFFGKKFNHHWSSSSDEVS